MRLRRVRVRASRRLFKSPAQLAWGRGGVAAIDGEWLDGFPTDEHMEVRAQDPAHPISHPPSENPASRFCSSPAMVWRKSPAVGWSIPPMEGAVRVRCRQRSPLGRASGQLDLSRSRDAFGTTVRNVKPDALAEDDCYAYAPGSLAVSVRTGGQSGGQRISDSCLGPRGCRKNTVGGVRPGPRACRGSRGIGTDSRLR